MFATKPIIESEIVEFLRRQCDDNMYIAQSMWRELQKQFPQVNERTRIQYERATRAPMHYAIPTSEPYRPTKKLENKPGMFNLVVRILAPIHKVLKDHEHHELDRPKGWKPLDISQMGRRWVWDGSAPVSGKMTVLSWEWKQFGYHTPYDFDNRSAMLPPPYTMRYRDLYFAFAYNPIEDILYYDDYRR